MTQSETFNTADSETVLGPILAGFAVLLWAFILYYAIELPVTRAKFAILTVGGSILLYLLNESTKSLAKGNRLELVMFAVFGLIDIVVTVYMYSAYSELISSRIGVYYSYEYLLALLFIAVIMYLSYRSFGLPIVIAFILTAVYAYTGEYLPGILGHGGLSETRLIAVLVLEMRGVYGSITQIVAAWVALFLLYTGLAQAYGAFDLILRMASRFAKFSRSGVAQFAVVSSMIVGSINGSPSANTAMTGSITIPMMKRSGLPGHVAGGVEATASSSGQIVPPVMGSAAFIMASILGITYLDVIAGGLLPVLIFGTSIMIGVHLVTLRYAPEGLDPNIDINFGVKLTTKELLYEVSIFLIPFAVLIYLLGIVSWTIMTSAMVTVFVQVLTGILLPVIKPYIFKVENSSFGDRVIAQAEKTLDGLLIGATIFAPIVIIIALINGLIDLLGGTGLSGSLSLALIGLSQGTLLVAGLLSIVICILLGMGMPSVAAYSIVAVLVAPTLIEEFGVPALAAHYFVFYSVILSFFTPPVATAAVIASGIAGADFFRTCISCLRIAVILLILPMALLYNPIIVVGGSLSLTLLITAIILLGGVSVTHGLNYNGKVGGSRTVDIGVRAFFVIAGLFIAIHPNIRLSGALLALATAVYVAQYSGEIKGGITQVWESSDRFS